MRCKKCGGPMSYEFFIDLDSDLSQLKFYGWRCIMCGDIIDEILLKNRSKNRSGARVDFNNSLKRRCSAPVLTCKDKGFIEYGKVLALIEESYYNEGLSVFGVPQNVLGCYGLFCSHRTTLEDLQELFSVSLDQLGIIFERIERSKELVYKIKKILKGV